MGKGKIGDLIQIIEMFGEPNYSGKIGVITHIDSMKQMHGTWGGCAIVPGDKFIILSKEKYKYEKKCSK